MRPRRPRPRVPPSRPWPLPRLGLGPAAVVGSKISVLNMRPSRWEYQGVRAGGTPVPSPPTLASDPPLFQTRLHVPVKHWATKAQAISSGAGITSAVPNARTAGRRLAGVAGVVGVVGVARRLVARGGVRGHGRHASARWSAATSSRPDPAASRPCCGRAASIVTAWRPRSYTKDCSIAPWGFPRPFWSARTRHPPARRLRPQNGLGRFAPCSATPRVCQRGQRKRAHHEQLLGYRVGRGWLREQLVDHALLSGLVPHALYAWFVPPTRGSRCSCTLWSRLSSSRTRRAWARSCGGDRVHHGDLPNRHVAEFPVRRPLLAGRLARGPGGAPARADPGGLWGAQELRARSFSSSRGSSPASARNGSRPSRRPRSRRSRRSRWSRRSRLRVRLRRPGRPGRWRVARMAGADRVPGRRYASCSEAHVCGCVWVYVWVRAEHGTAFAQPKQQPANATGQVLQFPRFGSFKHALNPANVPRKLVDFDAHAHTAEKRRPGQARTAPSICISTPLPVSA